MKVLLNCLWCVLLLTGCRLAPEERFMANARINDKPVRFAYDTGSEGTVIFARSAKQLGLKISEPPNSAKPPPGSVLTGRSGFCRFTVSGETYRLRLATVRLPWPWESLFEMDGVIGWPDIKDDYVRINAAADAIQCVDKLPQDTNGWITLPLYRRSGVLALEMQRADGKTGVLEVDTGNPDGVSLSPARWKEWRRTHRHARKQWAIDFMPGSGMGIGRAFQADDLALGPLYWKGVPVRKATRTELGIARSNDVFEASIGIAALRQWDLIIDQKTQTAYWQRKPEWISMNQTCRPTAPDTAASSTNSTVHFRFREQEYWDLAAEALDSGKFEEGISNLNRFVELEPTNAAALALRGEARFGWYAAGANVTNLDRSLDDFTHALELDPSIVRAYYARGNVRFITQRWDEALKDYRRFCESNPDDPNYPRFYIWLIRARQGDKAAADQELGAYFGPGKQAKADAWERKIAAFLLGRITEAEFIHAALRGGSSQDAGRQCEAWFYAGMQRELSGDNVTAREYFQRSVATGKKEYDEYNFATAQLRSAPNNVENFKAPAGARHGGS